jgi:quercetin dioxygenase-like cupin family protein
MISRTTFMFLIAIYACCISGCDNQSKEDQSVNSTHAGDTTASSRYTRFDSSRGVTAISPNLYKQLADTLDVRVLMGTYKPGDSSIMHAHPDFALYVLDGGTVELTGDDGNKQNIEFTKDMAVVLPAATHSAKNIGNTTLRLIVVEVNRPRD